MSWIEDQDFFGLEEIYADSYIEEYAYNRDTLTGEILWETKTFDLIPISQMTTKHIQNALRMCIKNNWRTEYIPVFQKELKKETTKQKQDNEKAQKTHFSSCKTQGY